MPLREGDALPYLRMKQQLLESTTVAILADGRTLPVFFRVRNGAQELFVEIDYQWLRTSVVGVVRYELSTEGKAELEAEAEAEREALKAQEKPTSYHEFVEKNDKAAMQALSDQYTRRRQQQGLVSNHPLTDANRRFAEEIASQRGQKRSSERA